MDSQGLRPGLSLFDSATLVAGSMIGSGIFIVSADIARHVGSPAAILTVWIVSGLMTIAGALSYGELAAMMPQAGGQYVYLREAYGRLWAFLFGWTMLLVIQTGTIAAVAVAFARFAGVLWPALGASVWLGDGSMGLSGERLGAIAVIVLLTAANARGLDAGRVVQNVFTSAKVLSLLLIITLGCVVAPNHDAIQANFAGRAAFFGSAPLTLGFLSVFGAAMVGSLFSADAWASVTFAASEVRDPKRDLPRALAGGTILVIALYVLTNLAYLLELPARSAGPGALSVFGARDRECRQRSGRRGGDGDRVGPRRRGRDRDSGDDLDLRLRQRPDSDRRARDLRDGRRRGLFRRRRAPQPRARACAGAQDSGGLGVPARPVGYLFRPSGLCSLCSVAILCSGRRRDLRDARDAAAVAAALSGVGLPLRAGRLSGRGDGFDGQPARGQAALLVARVGDCNERRAGLCAAIAPAGDAARIAQDRKVIARLERRARRSSRRVFALKLSNQFPAE
jgi:hypothetical protein